MSTLPEIRTQLNSAMVAFEDALKEVCKLAEKDPAGPVALAALNGYQREMEALKKIELNLIANGRPTA